MRMAVSGQARCWSWVCEASSLGRRWPSGRDLHTCSGGGLCVKHAGLLRVISSDPWGGSHQGVRVMPDRRSTRLSELDGGKRTV